MSIVDDYDKILERKIELKVIVGPDEELMSKEIVIKAGDRLVVQYHGDNVTSNDIEYIGETVGRVLRGESSILVIPDWVTLKVLRVK